MNDLFDAYINNATTFAIIHGIFIVSCVCIWIIDTINLRKEERELNELQTKGLLNWQSPASSNVITIAQFSAELARKGTAADIEAISRRLFDLLSSSDSILRAFINGLIVVGLLGTLFNLWHLSPAFWNSLLEGNSMQKDLAIGIAFAASFFGLLWSLSLNFIDNLWFRRRRKVFVQKAAEYISLESIKHLSSAQEAAVVNALDKFIETSEATIDDLKETSKTVVADLGTKISELTQPLIDQIAKSSNSTQALINQIDKSSESLSSQINNSSQLLSSQFDKILRRWWRFFNDAVNKIREEEERLAEATEKLINAANNVSTTLERTTDTLQGYKELDEIIAELRTQSVELVSQITQQFLQLKDHTKTTIAEITEQYTKILTHQSEDTQRRLSDLMDAWHTRSAGILTPFGETIRKTGEDFSLSWQQLSNSLAGRIESLVIDWQRLLNNSASELKISFEATSRQLKEAEKLSIALTKSTEKLAQVAKNIPLVSGKTNNSDEVIKDLLKKLDGQFDQYNKIAGQLLDKLDALPNQISQTTVRKNETYNRPTAGKYNATINHNAQPNTVNNNKPSVFSIKRWFGNF